MDSRAVHGKVLNGDVEPAASTDATLQDLLDQIQGATVLVTVTVLEEPCIGCIHR